MELLELDNNTKKNRKVPPDEELTRLYLDDRLSAGKIAKMFSTAPKTVYKHLVRLGIMRNRSEGRTGVVTEKVLKRRMQNEISTWAGRSGKQPTKQTAYCQMTTCKERGKGFDVEKLVEYKDEQKGILKVCKDCYKNLTEKKK